MNGYAIIRTTINRITIAGSETKIVLAGSDELNFQREYLAILKTIIIDNSQEEEIINYDAFKLLLTLLQDCVDFNATL